MDPPMDSIDGLGLTFHDLSRAGKQRALFRLARRQDLPDAQRATIKRALVNAKAISDRNQEILNALLQEPHP